MQAKASDAKGTVLLHQEPHLPRSSLGETILEDEGDEDMDVDADTDVAEARPHLLHPVHPPYVHYNGKGTSDCGSTPSSGWRALYTHTPGKHPNATVM
jgi:hypothetical protein